MEHNEGHPELVAATSMTDSHTSASTVPASITAPTHSSSSTLPTSHPNSSTSATTPTAYPPSPSLPSKQTTANHPLSLASYLAEHPTHSVKRAINKRYPTRNPVSRLVHRFKVRHNVISGLTQEEMAEWEKREGKARRKEAGWRLEGEQVEPGDEEKPIVSELFWKMYTSILPTFQRDPLSGLVPPALIGSTTTMPMTIISLIPDIMRHYHDCIIRAEEEVFLITNYWQPSNSVNTIGLALRTLSAKHVQRHKDSGSTAPIKKIIVKLIYDRGSWEQLVNAHADVPPKGWGVLNIPEPKEIEGLELEVMNYHKVLLGTLHIKFCIVDRKVALINSNNIQDRPNLELMTHLEGPIVDSFYEAALLSWYNKLKPMLPRIARPFVVPNPNARDPLHRYKFREDNPYFADIEILKAAKAARILLRSQRKDAEREDKEEGMPGERLRDVVRRTMERGLSNIESTWEERRERLMGVAEEPGEGGHGGWDRVRAALGSRPNSRRQSMEVVDDDTRLARPSPFHHELTTLHSTTTGRGSPTLNGDTHDAIKADGASPEKPKPESNGPHIKIVDPKQPAVPEVTLDAAPEPVKAETAASPEPATPDLANGNGSPKNLGPPLTSDNKPVTTKPRSGSIRQNALSERFNAGALSEAWATVEDSDDLDTFQPHVFHAPHKPFPVAMVCRKPHGMPGHHDIRNPQNAAWLAGFRYAKRRVFIQTPTLNARPIVRAIKQTCRREVEVILFLDLGFNDKGESIPFQGGTNEQVAERLYNILRPEGKAKFLKIYWYTGKDQIRPLNAIRKQRNAHVKFANFDDEVAILGNGNQDTQSWFHSSESNIMIDSKPVIAELMQILYTNQNTQLYGLIGEDGIWRDGEGKDLTSYGGTAKGKYSGFSGIIQFAKTI